MQDTILAPLNPTQRDAVTAPEEAVLVLAGAGSGKTRVIAHRVAYLLREKHLSPHSLLAVTFTNKAAAEMRERILKLLQKDSLPFLWIGTFHSVCARILRADVEALSGAITRNFTILDSDDSVGLVRHFLRERGISDRNFPPRTVLSVISRAKAESMDAEAFYARAKSFGHATIAPVYRDYERRLLESNALDFDDLLHLTERLLREREDVRERYQGRFLHVLVDEYQDTNRTQYRLLRHLSGRNTCLFAVGDEDQSVYRWRGAEIANILDFKRDFPKARIVKLERNYRSTKAILDAANALVACNTQRLGKNLWTERQGGPEVAVYAAPGDREEAAWVADTVRKLHATISYRQIAVLYRTNAQSRTFEEAFLNRSLPYQVVGGMKFYERKEVKDLLSYLRLAVNPMDRVSLLRVINVPPRGIGKATIEELEAAAREREIPLLQAVKEEASGDALPARARVALKAFVALLEALRLRAEAESPADAAQFALKETGYLEYLEGQSEAGPDPLARVENLRELVSAMREFETREGGDLRAFLERQALVSDQDTLDTSGADTIKLMTLHAVKGLEFPAVFLTGLEEGFLPHSLSEGAKEEVEEERRLCYVGMTRAMDRLHLTWSRQRYIFGTLQERRPSPFLKEIPSALLSESAGVSRRPISFLEAAAALASEPQRPKPSPAFRTGGRVHHPKYGYGIVLATEGEGEELKVTVSFNAFGRKKLLQKMAKMRGV